MALPSTNGSPGPTLPQSPPSDDCQPSFDSLYPILQKIILKSNDLVAEAPPTIKFRKIEYIGAAKPFKLVVSLNNTEISQDIDQTQYESIRDHLNARLKFANDKTLSVTKNHKVSNLLQTFSRFLKLGNVNWGIDRNRFNTCLALVSFLILVLALVPAGLPVIAITGIGIAIVSGILIILVILVTTKKMSVPQAAAYVLITFLITGLVLSPFGATALLVFKILYGVTLIVQGAVFGVLKGGVGLAVDKSNYSIARELNDSTGQTNIKLAFASDGLSIAKGLGYTALGFLKIVATALCMAIPGYQALDEATTWITRVVYYGLVNASLYPKIHINLTDIKRYKQYHEQLQELYRSQDKEACIKTLLWLKQNAIGEIDCSLEPEKRLALQIEKIKLANEQIDSSIPELIYDNAGLDSILDNLISEKPKALENAQAFIDLMLASNQRKLENAKTQLKTNLVYLISNTLLVFFNDPVFKSESIVNWISEKIFQLSPEAIVGIDPTTRTPITEAQSIRRVWENSLSAIKSWTAAQINVANRDYAELPQNRSNAEKDAIARLPVSLQEMVPDLNRQAQGFHDHWYLGTMLIAESVKKAWKNFKTHLDQNPEQPIYPSYIPSIAAIVN